VILIPRIGGRDVVVRASSSAYGVMLTQLAEEVKKVTRQLGQETGTR
jgi:hypothetical protein